MKTSYRAGLHREPLNSTSSTFHQVKRASGMHLKPYLKLQKKERSLDISQDSLRGLHMNHQRSAQEEKYTNNCTKLSILPTSPVVTPSRKPLGIIYPNTMCNMSGKAPAEGPSVEKKKNAPSATIHQGDEGEGPLDIWAVVKPGNTKEKIAFFAAQQCNNNRMGSMKLKSTWDIDGRSAKRRKKSMDLIKAKIQLERMREANRRCTQPEPFACGIEHCSVHYVNDNGEGIFPGRSLSVIEMVAFLEHRANALLADCTKNCMNASTTRLSGQSKGALPASDPFSAPGACEVHSEKGTCGSGEQQNEPVRVLDMVAKLESECLRRQSEREAGSLSRNNSFRRNIGRMLLANGTQSECDTGKVSSKVLGQEVSLKDPVTVDDDGQRTKRGPSVADELWEGAASGQQSLGAVAAVDIHMVNISVKHDQETSVRPSSRGDSEMIVEPLGSVPSACPVAVGLSSDAMQSESTTVDCSAREPVSIPNLNLHPTRRESLSISISVTKTEKGCRKEQTSNFSFGEDPLPGRLFFLYPGHQNKQEHTGLGKSTKEKPGEVGQTGDAADNKMYERNSASIEPFALSVSPMESALQVLDTSCLKRQVSHDFLETRFKIQQLLEPQQYMAFLPHHIMVKIFRLLPTRSLVALKCTCCYFKFIIEYYNIRPADSRWVRDPRYKEDPCKQCKKKYVKGDVSLCRWHPKPYCQALPYGPGYWMCCHKSQKGIPGCKLGLHDNHWVPACHSFNRTLHKKTRGGAADAEEEY
ncbi:F-box only protein 34 isoform X1 [Chelonia mydas]|nr:F-box only protein 34 isoform X1 [Chelonia mydas]XP_037757156.1 F-box only protein 34 isoform X1 [Chelonia mydas]XP_037757157.1 F-box only protein 34 isoform X1 [Chelonia mydas]XP_037757158.1 F-box only protein 34 isoform X1 [Chelonia mydas]XP_037757159.1 F-box only protein 34 isoform X1 [Chelonia mydas]XP_037757160.1 F-box only protein 34 isoform X1 [Chelonia mydas]XP_037757161.1 F-box only protein 34 isoform X1 [Chelonia mydas]XP_037757164.1 F-box only protein 34 isoform X1 [Chelonia my